MFALVLSFLNKKRFFRKIKQSIVPICFNITIRLFNSPITDHKIMFISVTVCNLRYLHVKVRSSKSIMNLYSFKKNFKIISII